MQRFLLTFSCLIFLFSCSEDKQSKQDNMKNNLADKTVTCFSITSKDNKLTSQSGTNVSINEMSTKKINSGEEILFKSLLFTLDNKTDGAINFYSENGKLMCDVPFELSVMSMPPDKNGATIYNQGDKIKLSGISLIKTNSTNFVISDITFSNTIEK
tara:strand:- start:13235 stop:13705 length:471 start_codon:yes stop_codon:yes gene_type:complete